MLMVLMMLRTGYQEPQHNLQVRAESWWYPLAITEAVRCIVEDLQPWKNRLVHCWVLITHK